jgi:hypothetical protein
LVALILHGSYNSGVNFVFFISESTLHGISGFSP